MGVVRSGYFWHLGSIVSLVTETTGGEILVTFWPKHGLRSNLRVPNFPGGACPHTPLAYSHSMSVLASSPPGTRLCPYQSNGSSPGSKLWTPVAAKSSATHAVSLSR